MSVQLDALADVIRGAAGLQLEQNRQPALRAALARAWPGVSHAEVLRRALDPATELATIATLIDEYTIKETSFLRDRNQLASIDWHALRGRAATAGSDVVRVWSAACATGAEPYSLAMLACEAFASTSPPVRILATDISSAALAAAAAGSYGNRSVSGVEERLRSRYLQPSGNDFVVIPALRRLVELAQHNLVSDPYPPRGEGLFNLILCRNVLIYFDPATCAQIVGGLEQALASDGTLVLGAADALCVPGRPPMVGVRVARPSSAASVRARRPRRAPSVAPQTVPPSPPGEDPMDPAAHYERGLDELESGDAVVAVSSLRRALYLDPASELAAFALGRAHEKAGDSLAARRSYQQTLRLLRGRSEPGGSLAGGIPAFTVTGACEARLAALAGPASPMAEPGSRR
jgi:chemotaxis protein methyltransferase CheR